MEGRKIKGLPVISLDKGNYLGKAQDVLFNAEGKAKGFLVGEKTFMKSSLKFLLFEDVYKIGSDAIIAREETALSEEPSIAQGYPITGQRILSEDGSAIGFVSEFSLDPSTGTIQTLQLKELEVKDYKKDGILKAEALRNLGKDYIIASESYLDYLEPFDKAYFKDRPLEVAKGLSRSLELRAIEFSLGREAAHTVEDEDGTVIVAKGEIVTEAVIDRAREASKLYQLLFAAGVGELLEGLDYTRERLDQGSKHLLDAWERFKQQSQKIFHKSANHKDEGIAIEGEDTHTLNELIAMWDKVEKEILEKTKDLSGASKENLKQYIDGKKAAKSVYDREGNLIVGEGDIITPSSVEKAEKGEKLSELVAAAMTSEFKSTINTFKDSISDILK